MDATSGPTAVPCMTVPPSLVPHVQALLDAAGIPHFVKNDAVQELVGWGSAAFGYNVVTGAPVVMVEPARLEEAREILRALVEAPEPPVPRTKTPSRCPSCGRELDRDEGEPPLADCYHCGAPLRGPTSR
jgi:hypothetical protein